jgi:hypothetical protein
MSTTAYEIKQYGVITNKSKPLRKKKPHCNFHSFISIQSERPGWQEPESSHVTGMALAHCILGKVPLMAPN